MTDSPPPTERRANRRLTMGSAARLIFERSDAIDAECVDISVGGMTLRANYVPGQSEVLVVEVPPPTSGLPRPPLRARVEVKRCHQVGPDLYEIGGAIVQIIG